MHLFAHAAFQLIFPLFLLASAIPVAHAGFDPSIEKLATRTALVIQAQSEDLLRPLQHAAPHCTDLSASAAWAQALEAKGDLAGCARYAQQCLDKKMALSGDLLAAGATCSEKTADFQTAFAFYEKATSPDYRNSAHFTAHVFSFAKFARLTEFASETSRILRKNPEWDSEESARWVTDVIDYLDTGDAKSHPENELNAWIASTTLNAEELLKSKLTLGWTEHLLLHAYLYPEALSYFSQHLDDLRDPQSWIQIAYRLFYMQNASNFRLARRVYDAYLPYAHPRSWLPTELNTYDYSQLYSSACKTHLSQGAVFFAFKRIKRDWVNGSLSSESALIETSQLRDAHPQSADLEALLGGIQDHLGLETEAAQSFWRSHQLCPYFDRSHWGLERIRLRQKNRAYRDYPAILDRIDLEVSGIDFPPELPQYVLNWPFLTLEAQKRLKYAIRFWAPFVKRLYASGSRLYVKSGVQYLSDVPGLESLKNTRIDYDHDNRLWDDVRGAGGEVVAVDFDQMMEGAFGDFNLAGHEITHQFQGHSAKEGLFPAKTFACTVALYEAAKKRKVFPDPYAGRNFLEYLAQGVAYSMIPRDSPVRFGLNASWFHTQDPDLETFLGAMRTQSQELDKIECPVSL